MNVSCTGGGPTWAVVTAPKGAQLARREPPGTARRIAKALVRAGDATLRVMWAQGWNMGTMCSKRCISEITSAGTYLGIATGVHGH